MKFLDEAKIYARAGDGGRGAVSFRREKFIARGGPDGGDGAKGGDIIAECVAGLNTLIDYRYRQHFKAAHGKGGAGKNRSGAKGEDRILPLPIGTQIFDAGGEIMLAELTRIGQRAPILYGGLGGRGNASFKSSKNQAPKYAQRGQKGQESWLKLRLRIIAHAGLVGLPNAGKSSLLAALSAARPKIADYPFTTLTPHLGLVRAGELSFVLADIPGLIEGAHHGAGLGQKFLRHIERCEVLLHLIDGTRDDIVESQKLIREELRNYSEALTQKTELMILTKRDLISAAECAAKIDLLARHSQGKVLALSSATHDGLAAAKHLIADHIGSLHSKHTEQASAWHP